MISEVRTIESYLGEAAFVQNRGAKPWDCFPRECSQGGSAMDRREEARFLDLAGGPLSPNEGRVSPSRTKPSLLVSRSSRPTTNAERWLGGKVGPVLRPGKGFVSLTDEVPRSSSSHLITASIRPSRKEAVTLRQREQPLPGPALRDVCRARVGRRSSTTERQNHRAIPKRQPVHGTS